MITIQLFHYLPGYGLTMGEPITIEADSLSGAMRHFTRLPTRETGRAETLAAKVWPASNPRAFRYLYFVE